MELTEQRPCRSLMMSTLGHRERGGRAPRDLRGTGGSASGDGDGATRAASPAEQDRAPDQSGDLAKERGGCTLDVRAVSAGAPPRAGWAHVGRVRPGGRLARGGRARASAHPHRAARRTRRCPAGRRDAAVRAAIPVFERRFTRGERHACDGERNAGSAARQATRSPRPVPRCRASCHPGEQAARPAMGRVARRAGCGVAVRCDVGAKQQDAPRCGRPGRTRGRSRAAWRRGGGDNAGRAAHRSGRPPLAPSHHGRRRQSL